MSVEKEQNKSLVRFREIIKHECVVLHPVSNKETIPVETTFNTISPLDLIDAYNVFQRKVLPVPP